MSSPSTQNTQKSLCADAGRPPQAFEYAVEKAPLYAGIPDEGGRCCRPARYTLSTLMHVTNQPAMTGALPDACLQRLISTLLLKLAEARSVPLRCCPAKHSC